MDKIKSDSAIFIDTAIKYFEGLPTGAIEYPFSRRDLYNIFLRAQKEMEFRDTELENRIKALENEEDQTTQEPEG